MKSAAVPWSASTLTASIPASSGLRRPSRRTWAAGGYARSSGLATEHTVRIPVLVSSDAVIEIKVDSSVYATKADLDEMRGTLTGAQAEQMKTVRCLGRHDADIVALQSGAEQTNRTLSALQRAQATDNAVQEAGLAALERHHVEEMRDMGVSMTGVLLQQMKMLKRLSTIELNN